MCSGHQTKCTVKLRSQESLVISIFLTLNTLYHSGFFAEVCFFPHGVCASQSPCHHGKYLVSIKSQKIAWSLSRSQANFHHYESFKFLSLKLIIIIILIELVIFQMCKAFLIQPQTTYLLHMKSHCQPGTRSPFSLSLTKLLQSLYN